MSCKSRKILSSIIITVYISLNFVSVFHFHPGYSATGSSTFSSELQGKSFFDPFMDSNSKCQLQQFSSTNYLDNSFRNPSSAVDDGRTLFTTKTFTPPRAYEGWCANLRAPPYNS